MKKIHINTFQGNMAKIVTISLLAFSSFARSASYSSFELEPTISNDENQFSPFNQELGKSPSLLESIEQVETNKIKSDYVQIIELIKQNKPKEAGTKISALLKKSPNEPEFYNLKGLLETLESKSEAAEKSYKKALELDPRNFLAHLSLAKMNLDAGNFDKAKDFADKAININNKNISPYLVLSDVAYKQKQYSEVEHILLSAQTNLKGDIDAEIEVINNLAKLYGDQKQTDKTLSISEELIKNYPNNTKALSVLAGAQIVNKKMDEAEKTLRQIINQESQDIDHRLLLARLLSEKPNTETEVIQLAEEASAIAPKKSKAIVFKITYLIKLKRFEEALTLANKADSLFPDLTLGTLLKGDIYLAEKKLDKALESYQQAYKKQPSDKVLFIIVDLMNAQNQTPQTVTFLKNAVDKNPKNLLIRLKLATAYQQLKDYRNAEVHYKKILSEQPNSTLALNNLAWLYLVQNNKQALKLANKAYSIDSSAAYADTYGYSLLKLGKPEEGLTILEKAANLAPNANDILLHLAEAYVANKNKDKAIEILEKIVKSEENSPDRTSAISLLDKIRAQ
jgi:putative PEP-CTERM system TPR-repeat lipoprotein